MPIYEYVCRQCEHEFEWLSRQSEEPTCPSCGRRQLTKKLSLPFAHMGSAGPTCPVKEAGACGVSDCGSGQCGHGHSF